MKATKILTAALLLLFVVAVCGCFPKAEDSAKSVTATKTAANVTGNVPFRDVLAASGITYKWQIDGPPPLTILSTIGNGCAFLDYDNDGNLDILLVGNKVALYKGDGKGHFTDVSQETGIAKLSGTFLGCAVGDYDNDGFADIYISAYHGGVLLHNVGGKRFENVTVQSGIAAQPWGTSCGWADVDNDGKLDLFVGNYVDFGPKTDPQHCLDMKILGVCGPRFYKEKHGTLYRNLGDGKFQDVTKAWGADSTTGKVLGVAWSDYNNSGKQSLMVANDEMSNDLLKYDGKHFINIGATSGVAYDGNGALQGGMGIDWGDYDNDGKLDLVKGTFQHEIKSVYHNEGNDLFTDNANMLNMASSMPFVAFGVKWLDYDNDGWLDLVFANGHVQDNIAEHDKTTTFRQSIQLFHNEQGKRFTEIATTGTDMARQIVGRGLAVGDFDNDGKVDVLVVDSDGAPLLLHNESKSTNHYLTVLLNGTKSNRDGVGALVIAEMTNGVKMLRRCGTDGSYLSASDKRIHFGLGKESTVKTVTVKWPSGKKSVLQNVAGDKQVTIRE